MFFKNKKKKKMLYPSVYADWIKEFMKLDNILIREEDATLFRNGDLVDRKFCIVNFEREMTLFLEKQLTCYFKELSKLVQEYVEENDYEYLVLMIHRYHLRYRNLYFFLNFGFLDDKFKESMKKTLDDKLYRFDNELITYFNKVGEVSPSMGEMSINIKRLIEV